MSVVSTAFVLINSELGMEERLIKELSRLQDVAEVHGIFGVYDILVKAEADSMEKLKELVTWKIRSMHWIKSTLTLIKIEGQGLEGARREMRDFNNNKSKTSEALA